MDVSDFERGGATNAQNAKLKWALADSMLDNVVWKVLLGMNT